MTYHPWNSLKQKVRHMVTTTRRVIYGLDDQGRSTFVIDDVRHLDCPGGEILWHSTSSPADNSNNEDTGGRPFDPAVMYDREGSSMSIFCLQPDEAGTLPDLYASDTIGYVSVLSGRVVCHADTGKVELSAGDVVVVRGVNHSVRAIGDEPAVTTVVMVPSLPLKAGPGA